MATGIEVRRAGERYAVSGGGIESRYAFSFGDHYDPRNIEFGPLLACNEETLLPGAGFEPHRHRDTEIITWVVDGVLEHRDSVGNGGEVRPGTVQRMSAGAGVRHTERNAGDGPVRFVQMWLRPGAFGGDPDYEQRDVAADLAAGGLVLVASGRGDGGVSLRQPDARLHAGRLADGEQVALPGAALVYVHVVRGGVRLGEAILGPGDSARLTEVRDVRAFAVGAAELLVWELRSGARRAVPAAAATAGPTRPEPRR